MASERKMNDFSSIGSLVSFRPPLSWLATKPFPLDGCPMFAFSRTWVEDDLFPMLSTPVSTYLQRKRRGCAHLVQPMYAKTRIWGTRPVGKAWWKAKDLLHNPSMTPVICYR